MMWSPPLDLVPLLQAVAQDDGGLAPANLYGQLLGVVINLVVAIGGAIAYHITQKTSRRREAAAATRERAAAIDRDRLAQEVRETAARIARELAEKSERERTVIAAAVKAELEKARAAVLAQAQHTELTVRHDVRNELTQQRIQIQQLQRQLAERMDAKLDAHGAKFDAAYGEANRTTEKFAELRKDFNAILGRESARDDRAKADEKQVDRIEDVGDDTNERVRKSPTPGETGGR